MTELNLVRQSVRFWEEIIMKIWLSRHGQTNLNKARLMQGRTDEPLNETGIAQAKAMRAKLVQQHPGLHFDAVFASPLDRAVTTGSILGDIPKDQIFIDERLIEADFGKYEKRKYYLLGPFMTLYWALPEIFPAPATVETIASLVSRSSSFLKELEQKDYENVLVACHGGILRALSGYMENRPNGIQWRPKPHNCEVRVWESVQGTRRFIEKLSL